MDDKTMVGLMRARDTLGLEALIIKYRGLACSIAMSVLGKDSREDVVECVNLAFYDVWLSMPESSVQQNLSIAIDEHGCEATAFTKIDFLRGTPPRRVIDFVLDRPFIFAITGGVGDAPLFMSTIPCAVKYGQPNGLVLYFIGLCLGLE